MECDALAQLELDRAVIDALPFGCQQGNDLAGGEVARDQRFDNVQTAVAVGFSGGQRRFQGGHFLGDSDDELALRLHHVPVACICGRGSGCDTPGSEQKKQQGCKGYS